MKKVFVIALLGYSVITLCGCIGAAKKSGSLTEEAFLEPQAALKFNDIPVPAGFKYSPEQSYSFESAGIRVGVLKYHGKADIDQVVNFYKNQMPLYSWRLLNAIEYGERLLNFERDQESCIVNLAAKGKNITITLSVGPKAGIQPKRPDKPVK